MSGERRDQPEQEISIRRRGHELFVDDSYAPTGSGRPFSEFLRETPAAPLPTWVKATLWAVAIVAAMLFAAALWKLINRPTHASPRRDRRPRVSLKAPSSVSPIRVTPSVAGRLSTPTIQEPRG